MGVPASQPEKADTLTAVNPSGGRTRLGVDLDQMSHLRTLVPRKRTSGCSEAV